MHQAVIRATLVTSQSSLRIEQSEAYHSADAAGGRVAIIAGLCLSVPRQNVSKYTRITGLDAPT